MRLLRLKYVTLMVLLASIFGAIWVLRVLEGSNPFSEDRFSLIEVGMSEEQVAKIVGPPRNVRTETDLLYFFTDSNDYSNSNLIPRHWSNDDSFIQVWFDANGKVVFRRFGRRSNIKAHEIIRFHGAIPEKK